MLALAAGLLLAIVYFVFLGHRLDYAGHYAAGYGGTLIVLTLGRAIISERVFQERAFQAVLVGCVACILAGALLEVTVFRLAKFDEVDFCNQSLGAVLASFAVLAGIRDPQAATQEFVLVTGVVFLAMGFISAFS